MQEWFKWFKLNEIQQDTRQVKPKYCEVKAKHARLTKAPISFLTNLLNEYHRTKK